MTHHLHLHKVCNDTPGRLLHVDLFLTENTVRCELSKLAQGPTAVLHRLRRLR